MDNLKLLTKKGFITYNKTVAKLIGINEALVLGELCSLSVLFKSDEFFYHQERMSKDTSLSVRQVRNAIQRLEQSNLLEVRKKGMPCRIWYKIKTDEIKRLLGSKTEEQVSKVCKYCGSMLVDNSGVGATWYCMNCRKEFVMQGKYLKEN